jgi:6-pyruvoyltetrahydropterin/6-carboxytetrahydropterin synthase
MPTVHITRRERFCASHRLARADWSDDRNLEVFGKCSNPNGHGHNYVLWVTVSGRQDPETSFVTDLSMLSRIIKEHVIDHIDHRNIDVDVPFMRGRQSSTENLCVAIWEQLAAPVNALGVTLRCVKVEETENNYAEYHGE